MATPDSLFPLEYVTGPVQIPPFDASVSLVEVWASVLNVGDEPAACQILGYRVPDAGDQPGEGVTPSHQEFDSGAAEVAPNAQRLVLWVLGIDENLGRVWLKVLAKSPNLVPSVEFAEFKPQDDPGPADVMLRYLPNDFALFHHRVRYVPLPPVGPIEAE